MIKNVIFDFGGVLLDWNPHYMYDSYFGSREEADYFINNILTLEWHNEGDLGLRPFMDIARDWGKRYPKYADAFVYYVKEFPNTVRTEIPGMYDYISNIKARGYHVWGLSNWSWETFSKVYPKYRIFHLMEGMVVSGLVHMIKPDPGIFQCLMDKYNLKKEECVFIDDAQRNIDGAAAFGLKGIPFRGQEDLAGHLEPMLAPDVR